MSPATDPRVVSLGEALVDLIGEAGGDEAVAYRAHPGGSPMNAAVAAARLGTPTAVLTRFSSDAFGALLRAHLTGAGVDLHLAEIGPEPTSLAVVTLDGEGRATYGFYRAETADVSYDPRPRPTLPPSVVVGNVTVSLLRPPAREAFLEIVRAHGRSGAAAVTWVVDPNARPALWPDSGAFAREVEAWAALADVVKVSDE
ncbi:MAG: PfkB family carbohydrate kinase, partial [bacterium]|nr:PfkB family carbohydrate kinase [bacterium]